MIDSLGSEHDISYNSTTVDSSGMLNVQLDYQSTSAYYKDPQLNVEFFTNVDGNLNWLGTAKFNISYFNSARLNISVNPSDYANDPYIYMRVGTLANLYDSYYSDTLTFKVINPSYSGSTPPTGSESDVLISNESTNGGSSEYTGSFKLNKNQQHFNKKLSKGAYKLDYVKPFDVTKNRTRLLKNKLMERSVKSTDLVGDNKYFWVANLETNQYEQIQATLLYSGTHGNVWVNNNQISSDEAAQLGQEFDNKIYPSDVNNFGHESDVDGNGKVNILCYDIQDGFSGSGGYVAGYFDPNDLSSNSNSNHSEIFYIDTYPSMGMYGTNDLTEAKSTLAHEFQHMINFNQNVLVEHHNQMDTWIDEGLAMAAEQIYSGNALSDRIDYYNQDESIADGHSLIQWDYDYDTLANYSLSYLFIQYLKIQCNQGNAIFKELLDDPNSDYQAVQDIVHKYIDPNLSLGKFMTDFREALYLNQSTGLFGFHGEPGFDMIQKVTYSGSPTYLQGGGAVVKQMDASSIPTDGGSDITYTNLSNTDSSDTTAPDPPTVNEIGDNDTTVTGKAEAGSTITVTANGQQIGTEKADSSGTYSVNITKQKAGTTLSVYATDDAGNKSAGTLVIVKDKTTPTAPTINAVGDNDSTVTGKAEAGATITVTKNGSQIGIGKADNNSTLNVSIPKQKAGTTLTVYAADGAGNKSAGTTITVKDKTAPTAPIVNTVGDNDTTVTGKAEAGSTITVTANGQRIGTDKADSSGTYSVSITKQKTGTTLSVYATDDAGNKSAGTLVIVKDKTAPTVNEVGDDDTTVTGKAELGSTITVTANGQQIGTNKADSSGTYSVNISKQKAGTTLSVYATDDAGNKSAGTLVIVKDKTAPTAPTVNAVGDNDSTVTGKAEAGATITVTANGQQIGTNKANSSGTYSVNISKQKAGTTLSVYATDGAGNKSTGTKVTVKDKTAPTALTVNVVGNNDTAVKGRSESNATIKVISNGKQIGVGKADNSGVFRVNILKQKVGTKLYIYAIDKSGNKSVAKLIIVKNSFSAPIKFGQVRVINNRGKSDEITVSGIKKGDEIRVYNLRNVVIVKGISKGSSIKLYVKQFGTMSGKINLTITQTGMLASSKTVVSYKGEPSGTISSNQVKVKNNKHKSDSVTITKIKKNDTIRVYNSRNQVIASKKANSSSVTLYIKQLGMGSGHIYVTITHPDMQESSKKYVSYRRE